MSTTSTNLQVTPITCGDTLSESAFAEVRRRAIFDCCKWDPQVGDVSVLCPFPLLIEPSTWRELSQLAEQLAAEALAAEAEIAVRPELHRELGLPHGVRRAMKSIAAHGASRGIARVMRFDFHWTRDGWRITEVNSDVPGGFIESCGFSGLIAEHVAGATVAGDPADALAGGLRQQLGRGAMVALVHATAYTDDRQVMLFLSRRFEAAGLRTCLISPEQLSWTGVGLKSPSLFRDTCVQPVLQRLKARIARGDQPFCPAPGAEARITNEWCEAPADAVVRFFPGEWLVNLSRRCGWRRFFAGSATPLCNPATALLTQSKRFPLVWGRLKTPLPAWRRLMPETRDPRAIDRFDEGWVLKPALGRVGEDIGLAGVTPAKRHRQIRRWAWLRPKWWAAQRRFQTMGLDSPDGRVYPCLGVWVIDGRARGIYGRLASTPLIDHQSRDVAVLVTESDYVL